jgi:hypothetical protein
VAGGGQSLLNKLFR